MNNQLDANNIIGIYRQLLAEANDKIVLLSAELQQVKQAKEGEHTDETVKK